MEDRPFGAQRCFHGRAEAHSAAACGAERERVFRPTRGRSGAESGSRENKDLPVYALVLGKGGLKQESPPDSGKEGQRQGDAVDVAATRRAGGVTVDFGNGAYFTFADNKAEARKMPASSMAVRWRLSWTGRWLT